MVSQAPGATLLILAIIALIFWIGPAALASWLADQRGREPGPWFAVGLLLGPLAVVAVGLSPVAYSHRCTECREGVAPDARRCPHCGTSFVAVAAPTLATPESQTPPPSSTPGAESTRDVERKTDPSATPTPTRRLTGVAVAGNWSRIARDGTVLGRWRVRGSDYAMIDEGALLDIRDEHGAIGLYRQDGQKTGLLIDGEYVLFASQTYPGHVLVGDRSASPILLLERIAT